MSRQHLVSRPPADRVRVKREVEARRLLAGGLIGASRKTRPLLADT
jgi:hypothetical protein